ncbi:hypothetical protein QAD02_004385 [Eretmocerus hayati]|uniref:Uncharacterized protein n=1 Tax=Eretmocerus hayati TaxID=131215 RepID=A0ACC2NQH3_9HYME|nr:hypothetical protein QAD02_004385 [Eretmocerus hayati]
MYLSKYIIILGSFACAIDKVADGATESQEYLVKGTLNINCNEPDGSSPWLMKVVIVTCQDGHSSWFNLTDSYFNSNDTLELSFVNCSLPHQLNLFSFSQVFNTKKICTLKIEGPQARLSRGNLQNTLASTLVLTNIDFDKLPIDLLQDAKFENLMINQNEMNSIPQGFFAKSENLRILEIFHNQIESLKKGDFQGLATLERLHLSHNKISSIELGTFDEMGKLLHLEILYNQLRTLPEGLFRSLDHLVKIDLSGNYFSSLPQKLFQPLNLSLIEIRLNENKGKTFSLPNGGFHNLSKLRDVELSNNGLNSIPDNLFFGSTSLIKLDISRNRLERIPTELFREMRQLERLVLSENPLEHLFHEAVVPESLKELHINSINLASLSGEFLAVLSNLRVLKVSNNKLSTISQDFCYHLRNVNKIDLSHNELSDDVQSILIDCKHLSEINLSYNNITQLHPGWKDVLGETYLYDNTTQPYPVWINRSGEVYLSLQGNKISNVDEVLFQILRPKLTLSLQDNSIHSIDFSKLYPGAYRTNLTNSTNSITKKDGHLVLEHNPLNCDCNLIPLIKHNKNLHHNSVYDYLKIQLGASRCAAPAEFETRLIGSLGEEELSCPTNLLSDVCNETCTCRYYPESNTLIMDCSYRNLTKVPRNINIPQNMSVHLNFSGNGLTSITGGLNVSVLDLSNNSIFDVEENIFSSSLRVLKLHNNRISRFNSEIISYLTSHFTSQNNLSLTLYGNEWICNCETKDFVEVFQNYLEPHQLDHKVWCQDQNDSLDNLSIQVLCNNHLETKVILLTFLSAFMFVLIILITTFYEKKDEIKAWLSENGFCFSCMKVKKIDWDKSYDVFLCFSHDDVDFVEEELVSRLEAGPDPYTICLHHRNWLAGEWIPDQIANSIGDSRMTIMVLSPNFIRSRWGRHEFRIAHQQGVIENKNRLIIILYGDINVQQLDSELQRYLRMNTYIRWGDPWFWTKLKASLPHTCERKRRKRKARSEPKKRLAQAPLHLDEIRLNVIQSRETPDVDPDGNG